MAQLNYQFQSCLAIALEDWPNVPGNIRNNVGCNPNIVHILSTFVSLDNCVQVFTHETSKSRHKSAENLCKSILGKNSASKNECKHFDWTLVRHLQTVVSLRAIKLAEEQLTRQVLCCVWQIAEWWILVGVVICNRTVEFPEIHKKTLFFRWVFSVQRWDFRTCKKAAV